MKNVIAKDFREEFQSLFVSSCQKYNTIFTYWINVVKNKEMPVYFSKYEDTVADNEGQFLETLCFLFGKESLEGTYIEKRLKDYIAEQNSGKTYERRSKEKEEDLATPDLIEQMVEACRLPLIFFGYVDIEGTGKGYPIKNVTAEEKEMFRAYKRVNQEAIHWHATKKEEIDNTFFECDLNKSEIPS